MPGSNAFNHILIAPGIVGDITWAETAIQSVHGEISSSWKITGNVFSLKVRIPANCKAIIELPQADPDKISENGVLLRSSENISILKSYGGKILIETASGEYNFTCHLSSDPATASTRSICQDKQVQTVLAM